MKSLLKSVYLLIASYFICCLREDLAFSANGNLNRAVRLIANAPIAQVISSAK